ncbi:phosphonate C-P lyase system protein PhnG [Zhengella sp. ZM62]|uniref:phosphonate C-P lyase system protein PhnG n=1 Tax=Zhengella sedimenti TaxID=3390035 RepID=UPI0039749C63
MALTDQQNARRARMGILARSSARHLMDLWTKLGEEPEHSILRGPETGAITVRGRMGGGGAPFNLGEATVTRAAVGLADGTVGHAMVLGRDLEKARIAALVDALCQDERQLERIESGLLTPLRVAEASVERTRREQTAATKVDFFTMVRGED